MKSSRTLVRVGSDVSLTWKQLRNHRSSLINRRCFSTLNREWRLLFENHFKQNNFVLTDWYKVQSSNLDEPTRQLLTKEFKGSLYHALRSLFPETEWLPWKFEHQPVPPKYWKDQSNQKRFFDELGKQIGIQNLDDWYQKLSKQLIEENNGHRILELNNGSVSQALMAAYPEHNWIPWKFNYTPPGFWKSKENQRKFFDWLGKELGVKQMDDWYRLLSLRSIESNGATRMLLMYNKSPVSALMAVYPEHSWNPNKFVNIRIHSKQPSTQLQTQQPDINKLKELLTKHSISQEEWYQVTMGNIDPEVAEIINNQFRGSLYHALSAVFPETEWLPWKFRHQPVPPNYWKSVSNQRKFFDDLGKHIGVQNLEDWYQKLTAKAVEEHGGSRILRLHKSPTDALIACYPEFTWIPTKFHTAPVGYWKSVEHQRQFFEELGKSLGIQSLDDWYDKLSHSVIFQHGGGTILKFYNGSATSALMASYPEHQWKVWNFHKVPAKFWGSKDNIKKFIADLSDKLSIQTLDDWYRVDIVQLKSAGAWPVVLRHQGLYNLLKEHYPHHPWDPKRFQQKGKKTQRWLAVTLKKMFPDEGTVNCLIVVLIDSEILEDYQHPKAIFPSSKRPMQLDVFIPSRSLAFEYQGKQHYEDVGVFSPSKTYQQRDEEKRTLCAANNIKLIEVPYWWNRTRRSLEEFMK